MIYNEKETMKKFGDNIKKYRNRLGLTQEKLAELCECSSQTISGTETGYSFPSSKVLFKLAENTLFGERIIKFSDRYYFLKL